MDLFMVDVVIVDLLQSSFNIFFSPQLIKELMDLINMGIEIDDELTEKDIIRFKEVSNIVTSLT